MHGLVQRLLSGNQLTHKELVSLAEYLEYKFITSNGSHHRYERSGYPQLVITFSAKRSNALQQYKTEKQLRLTYKEDLAKKKAVGV